MALGESLHHAAPRGQKLARARGVEREENYEPRPPLLQEAVTVGNVAAPGPLLSTPLLADTVADTVDARTVKFLLQKSLSEKKKREPSLPHLLGKEEEEKEEEKEDSSNLFLWCTDTAMWAWTRSRSRGFLMCSLPYCSSGRAGRRRWQWYVHTRRTAPRSSSTMACSASRPVWTRRTVAVAFARLVLMVTMHLALYSLSSLAGP